MEDETLNPLDNNFEAYQDIKNISPQIEPMSPMPMVNLGADINMLPKFEMPALSDPKGGRANGEALYADIYQNLKKKETTYLSSVPGSQLDLSGRFPNEYVGRDNEEMYSKTQTLGAKAYNGVAKFVGTATNTFINGTVGTVYGTIKAAQEGDISAFYNNDLSRALNDKSAEWENTYAHYKSLRERNGDWWEPANVFSGNFLFDNIIKNLGFSVGAMGAGFAWGGALSLLGRISGLVGSGEAMAVAADEALAKAAALPATERMGSATESIARLFNQAKSVAGNGLMNADRGIVATFGTFGEAGMEALNNSQEYRNKAVENYRRQYGVDPDQAAMAQINQDSESVGNWSFGLNTALLSVTNYVQLPKIASSSFKAEKNILNGVKYAKKAAQEGLEEYAESLPAGGFGKKWHQFKSIAKLGISGSESFEEGAQFAIQTGVQNYFDRKRKDAKGSSVLEDGLLHGVKEALTTGEGTLNIFTGGFSGALQQSGIIGIKKTDTGGYRPSIGGTGRLGEVGWTGYGGSEAVRRADAVKNFNETSIRNKMKSANANLKAGESIQQDRELSLRQGDVLESKDLEFDFAHTFVETRLKYKAKKAIDYEIENLREQANDPKGFDKLQKEGIIPETDTAYTFTKRLDNLQNHANHAAKLYEDLHTKYSGMMNKDGKRKYDDLVIDKLVYAGAKVNDYDKRIVNLNAELASNQISTIDILDQVINQGVPKEEALVEGFAQIEAVKGITEDEKQELQRDLVDVTEMAMRRADFLKEYKDIVTKPENHSEEEEEEEEEKIDDTELKTGTLSLKTKNGVREIETGIEYALGKVVDHDKDGNEVIRQPRLKILGENKDGTIKIKEKNGTIRDVSPEVLEDYVLVPEERMKEKKFKFFEAHQNDVYKHWNIKRNKQVEENGKMVWKKLPVEGRLVYSGKDNTLLFQYVDGAGNIKTEEVYNTMFEIPKGSKYPHPMLEKVRTLVKDVAAQEEEEVVDQEFFKEIDKSVEARNKERLAILEGMAKEILEHHAKAVVLVEQKTKQIDNAIEQIEKLMPTIQNPVVDKRYTKEVRYKKSFYVAMDAYQALDKALEQYKAEREKYDAERDELQYNHDYIYSMKEDLDSLPPGYNDLLKKFEDDIKLTQEAIVANGKTISLIDQVIKGLEKALEDIKDVMKALFNAFRAHNPDMLTPTGEDWETYIDKAPVLTYNRDVLRTTNDAQILELREYLSYLEDTEVAVNKGKIEDLKESIAYLEGKFKELNKTLKAQEYVNDKFKAIDEAYKAGKRQERKTAGDPELQKELLEVNDTSQQNTIRKGTYQPNARKDKSLVPRSGIVPGVLKQDYHLRTDRFAYRFETLPNKDEIKAVILTKLNEDELLPGLMQHLALDEAGDPKRDININNTIAMVFVRETEYGPVLVDEYGNDIDEDLSDEESLNLAVYQTMPDEDLLGYYPDVDSSKKTTMFRAGTTPQEEAEARAFYKNWREGHLHEDSTELGPLEPINPSKGIMEYVLLPGTTKRDFDARIPVTDNTGGSGLISEYDLQETPVLMVGINDEVANSTGTVVYNDAKGKVFLRTPNDNIIPVQNRLFTEKEADVIFDVILQAAKNADADGTLKTKNTQDLFEWLRTVCYWGTAVDQDGNRKPEAGVNNIWFDQAVDDTGFKSVQLFISNKGYKVPFTITSLENESDAIKGMLRKLYFNTRASLVNDTASEKTGNTAWDEDYYETIGIDANGQMIQRKWQNYQSFLLSPLNPDKSGKPVDGTTKRDIPLTTNVRPLLGKKGEDKNRKNFYFTLTGSIDDIFTTKKPAEQPEAEEEEEEETAEQKAAREAAEAEARRKAQEGAKGAPVGGTTPSGFHLDGKTPNTIKVLGKEYRVIVNPKDFTWNEGTGFMTGVSYQNPDGSPRGLQEVLRALSTSIAVATKNKIKYATSLIDPETNQQYQGEDLEKIKADIKAVNIQLSNVIAPLVQAAMAEQPVTAPIVEEAPIVPVTPEPVVETPAEDDEWAPPARPPRTGGRTRPKFRLAIKKQDKYRITPERWDKVEQFVKQSFPNIPFYRVKNMIQATNGRQAYGMLKEGAIYVAEGAEIGTAYHEVFEAVWKMVTPAKEQAAILAEFAAREGVFEDRETGRIIKYSEADPHQVKEQLAEEFREYVMRENPKPKSLIQRMFEDLINMIKTFFNGKDAQHNTNQLFERIGNGYYRKFNPYESALNYANSGIQYIEDAYGTELDEYRIEDIPVAQLNEIIQQMTFTTVNDAIQDNRSLFLVIPENKKKLYDRLYEDVHIAINGEISDYTHFRDTDTETNPKKKELNTQYYNNEIERFEKLADDIDANWADIRRKHMNHLKSYNIKFDEEDEENITKDDRRKDDGYGDARQIDVYRKATPAVKLFLNTIPELEMVDGVPEVKLSSIGGVVLYPGDKMFVTLMSGLHESINLDDMLERLRVMAMKDINYSAVYKRLTKVMPSQNKVKVDYSKLKAHDWQFITGFWKTMKKMNADVVTVFVLPSGEIVVSDSTLSSAAKQSKRDMLNGMVDSMRAIGKDPVKATKYFTYDTKTGKYDSTAYVKNYELDPERPETYVYFMKGIGVEFDLPTILNLKKSDPKKLALFRESVTKIKDSLVSAKGIVNISANTLGIEGRLFNLGVVKASIDNPEFESTYFNLNGDKTQTFLGTNILSSFSDAISKMENINDVETNPIFSQYKYLKTDVFAQGSQILKKLFSDRGVRRAGTENIFKPVLADGLVDEKEGDKTEASKLSSKERFILGMNLNLDGIFDNLVPGDASISSAIRMYDKGKEFVTSKGMNNNEHLQIFSEYFMSEVALARDNRTVVKRSDRGATDLRFFKDILSEDLYEDVKAFMDDKNNTPQMVYEKFEDKINRDVEAFFDAKTKKTVDRLDQYGIIGWTETEEPDEAVRIKLDSLDLPTYANREDMNKDMKILSINYMISVIEMHKLIYSDPYQYADELKRIKNFASPKQPLMVADQSARESMHKVFNQGFEKGKTGWIDFLRDHFRTVTIADILGFDPNLGYDNAFKETDGGGLITMKAYKLFRILAGNWTDANEAQYKHDMAYEDLVNSGASDEEVKEFDKKYNPAVKDTYTPLKPIAAGNKAFMRNFNDIILHKYALVPLSFRIQHILNPTSNAIALHDKMTREDIDYAVYESGSKVGTEVVHELYKGDRFNHDRFETPEQVADRSIPQGITRLPYSIMAVQSEVPSKDTPLVTQGSQITKLATMDFMEAGVPIDFEVLDVDGNVTDDFEARFQAWINIGDDEATREKVSELYKEIRYNQTILEAKIKEGYKVMLKKLGITEILTKDDEGNIVRAFELKNTAKLVETLTDEVLKREINENIIEALKDLEKEAVVIEATPVYTNLRNILFSIADKNVTSPKISGGQKVQIASRLLESEGIVAHEKEIKGEMKTIYSSDVLKFYSKETNENGKITKVNVCEMMVGRWFDSDLSDDELLDMWYVTDEDGNRTSELTAEGKKALGGIGFRIPTQKQNSMDVFVIKKFLPKEFGDSIVIPAPLVNKAGSDFDIDKLSVYLKNIFQNINGTTTTVPFLGFGEKARDKFGDMFDIMLSKDKIAVSGSQSSTAFLDKLFTAVGKRGGKMETKEEKVWIPRIREMYKDLQDEDGNIDAMAVKKAFESKAASLGKRMDKLTNEDIQSVYRSEFMDKMYMKSLENEYIESLERLISSPHNYDNLVKPNDASTLEKLSEKIQKKLGNEKIDYTSAGNMLDRTFMNDLRQAFVAGKYAIGIAATGQTGFAQRQRTPTYVNTDNMENVPEGDREVLGANPKSQVYAKDSNINFEKYNSAVVNGVRRPMLGMIKDQAGQFISDVNGMFIDGYVDISKGPWIMLLGATPNVTSTWLFLIDLGVPVETVAYFINQPIIKDYLASVENAGYSKLFIEDLISPMLLKYAPKNAHTIKAIPNQDALWETVGATDMKSDKLLSEQQYMLKEFVKYAKLAEHQFQVTQGSNFDTANFNDSFLVLKKQMQYEKGKRTLISSIDDLTAASFIGVLRDTMYNIKDAFATLLLSDRDNTTDGRLSIRKLLTSVLMPYVEMNDRDFVKVSQKAVADLFDFAMQTNPIGDSISTYSDVVASTLLGTETKDSVAQQIIEFKYKIKRDPTHVLYNNIVINSLKIEKGNKGKPDNLSLTAKDGKAYNQDLIIGAFKELRQHLEAMDSDMYGKLVRLAIMQSGLTNSPIAFSQLLPYEDFKKVYFPALSMLERFGDLNLYKELNVLQRNNWNNKSIVPFHKAVMHYEKGERPKNRNEDNVNRRFSFAMRDKIIPKVINVRPNSSAGRNDFIVYSVEDQKPTKEEKKQMKKAGDFSYIKKYLMQKVYTVDENGFRVPLIQISQSANGSIFRNYVYKHINAWGDSFKAQEFYKEGRDSVLDNGFEKIPMKLDPVTGAMISGEADDNTITSIYEAGTLTRAEVDASERTAMDMQPENIEKIKAGSKTTTVRASFSAGGGIRPSEAKIVNFGGQDFKVAHRGYYTIMQAGGKAAIAASEGFPTSPTAVNKIPVDVEGKTYYAAYQHTVDWMNGVGKMHVYDIRSSEPTPVVVSDDSIVKKTSDYLVKLGAKKTSKGLFKVDGQHYFLDSSKWHIMTKPYGADLFVYPNEDDEVYIGSSREKGAFSTHNFSSEGNSLSHEDFEEDFGSPTTTSSDNTEIKALRDRVIKYGLTDEDFDIVNVDGKLAAVAHHDYPNKLLGGYSTFYTYSNIGLYNKIAAKPITVPGYEDMQFVIQQSTRDVYELTTGKLVSGRKPQPTIIKAIANMKERLDGSDIPARELIAKQDKITANNPNSVITKIGAKAPVAVKGNTPKGAKVKEGIYVNQNALSEAEQMELFNYLKPFIEAQGAKTNKGANASKMIGLGLRWDYKSNNPNTEAVDVKDIINPSNKSKYGYYNKSINGQPLAPIDPRFRELMTRATGLDMTHYDGAIINLYDNKSFISSHNDVDESKSAIGYPVIGVNLGGQGNFSVESRDGDPKQLTLDAGSAYVFGVGGVNRDVFHRTFPTPQKTFLPEITTGLDKMHYPAGSYRVTITMRRVMPLEQGMPKTPAVIDVDAQQTTPPGRTPIKKTNDC